jgi:hypothetical protein
VIVHARVRIWDAVEESDHDDTRVQRQ